MVTIGGSCLKPGTHYLFVALKDNAINAYALLCLFTGGWQLIGDGNTDIHDMNKNPLEAAVSDEDNSNRSWLGRWLLEMFNRQAAKGPKEIGGDKLLPVLQAEGYENTGAQILYSPIGWAGDGVKDGEQIGEYMKTNFLVKTCFMR